MAMCKKNMEKPDPLDVIEEAPKQLVKRKPQDECDQEYLTQFKKLQKAEVMMPEIDGTQFNLDTIVEIFC